MAEAILGINPAHLELPPSNPRAWVPFLRGACFLASGSASLATSDRLTARIEMVQTKALLMQALTDKNQIIEMAARYNNLSHKLPVHTSTSQLEIINGKVLSELEKATVRPDKWLLYLATLTEFATTGTEEASRLAGELLQVFVQSNESEKDGLAAIRAMVPQLISLNHS